MLRKFALLPALASTLFFSYQTLANDEINVYSYRQDFLVQPLFDAFTKETGVNVNYVFAKDGLVERLKLEGELSPADVILTVDIGRLTDATANGVTQPVESEIINSNIPSQYRSLDNQWFGLTTRARIIVTSKDRVEEGSITNYEDLADPQWEGRICTRSGKHPYMVALTASVIENNDYETAKNWLSSVKDNLARKPQGNDRAQVKAILEGVCDIAVINSYYMGKMINDSEQKAWADSVNIVFPNQDTTGTHLNVSGMALALNSPNRDNAIKFMEFLTDIQAQTIYAEDNFEYPVNSKASWSELLNSWGQFKGDDLSLSEIASHRSDASKLADEVKYDL